MASDGFTEWMITTNYGPLGIRSEPVPEESPRSALSDRSWAHVVHNVEPTRHALSDRMLAHVRARDRARELEMVASHANVAELNLPPELIALAYDRNDGDLVNTIMNVTEPIFRRQLEHELAERQAEARMASERDDQERARNGLRYTMERLRRFVTSARAEEEEVQGVVEEEVEEEPDQRELDLWLLESQVPGCTRERAERAYAQGQEDVTRALPLARMATLLADREAMVDFLMEMQPGGLRVHAEDCYDETEGDIVDAVVDYHRRTAVSRNEEPMRDRCLHRLRIRTVFALALIYRERYGQLQPEASAAIAQSPLASSRPRTPNLPSFMTPDGVRWTYSAEQGWERRMEMEPAHVGRAAQATEQLARLADARGQSQTASRARQTAADMRNNAAARPDAGTAVIRTYVRHHNTTLTYSRALEYAAPSEPSQRAMIGREREEESEASDMESDAEEQYVLPEELVEQSGSSEDDENEAPTAGAYAQPRAFVRLGMARRESVAELVSSIKGSLRAMQEQLDTEMANANNGVVMNEGAYVGMMNAVKHIWESAEKLSK